MATPPPPPAAATPAAATALPRWHWVALGACVLLGLAARLWQNPAVPGGLHFDEAGDGLIGQSVLQGRWRVFYPEFSGKEPLYMFLLAASQLIWGNTAQAIRWPAALVGAATIAASWWSFRQLFGAGYEPGRATRRAWLAALSLGLSYWHFHLSRLGYRAIALPLAELLAVGALWTALRTRQSRWWVLAGLLNALVLYTYLSARFAPLVLAGFGLYCLLFHRRRGLAYLQSPPPGTTASAPPGAGRWWLAAKRRPVLAGAVAFGLGLAPLALYFVFNRREFFERTSQVNIFQPLSQAPGKLWAGMVDAARLISIEGSADLKYTSPGRPLFDWPLAVFFYAGLAIALWNWRKPVYGFVLIWAGVMFLPAVLSTEGNHPLRIGGAVPALFGLWATGLEAGWYHLEKNFKWGRWAGAGLAAGLLLFSLGSTWQGYFEQWAKNPQQYYAFDQDYLDFARLSSRWATEHPGTVPVIATESALHPGMIFGQPELAAWRWLDLNHSLILPHEVFEQNPPPVVEYLSGVRYLQNTPPRPIWNEWIGSDPVAVLPLAGYGGPGGAIYRYAPAKRLSLADLPVQNRTCGNVNFDGSIELLGYRARQENRTLTLNLFWQARQATAEDYRVFVHLVEQAGSSVLLGIGDGNGAYSQAWRPGDVIIGHHEIQLAPAMPARPYLLEVGFYDTASLKRMPLRPAPADPACPFGLDPANRQVLLTGLLLK